MPLFIVMNRYEHFCFQVESITIPYIVLGMESWWPDTKSDLKCHSYEILPEINHFTTRNDEKLVSQVLKIASRFVSNKKESPSKCFGSLNEFVCFPFLFRFVVFTKYFIHCSRLLPTYNLVLHCKLSMSPLRSHWIENEVANEMRSYWSNIDSVAYPVLHV